jgi:hypothetical protein
MDMIRDYVITNNCATSLVRYSKMFPVFYYEPYMKMYGGLVGYLQTFSTSASVRGK